MAPRGLVRCWCSELRPTVRVEDPSCKEPIPCGRRCLRRPGYVSGQGVRRVIEAKAVGMDLFTHDSAPHSSMFVHAMNRWDNLVHVAHESQGLAPTILGNSMLRLLRNPSPAQQLQFCTRESFGSIGDRAGGCVRPSSVVDYSDSAQQVYLGTRDSRLRWWVL